MPLITCSGCGLQFRSGNRITDYSRHKRICLKNCASRKITHKNYFNSNYGETIIVRPDIHSLESKDLVPAQVIENVHKLELSLVSNSYIQSNDNEIFYMNPTVPSQPHYKYTRHQIDIEQKFESMGNIKINRRAGEVDKSTFLQVMPLYCAFIENGMSIADGNKMLKAFKTCINNSITSFSFMT